MNERLRYSDHTKPVDTTPLKVDVIMIRIRPDDHQWVQEARQSVHEQSYAHLGLLECDNEDRSVSIGTAWNACVQASDADLVLFLGDDDAIITDLVSTLVTGWHHMRKQAPNLVHITCGCTVLDDTNGMALQMNVQHTGMFLRQYLVDHPFDVELERNVGHAQVNAIAQVQQSLGQPMTSAIVHHQGYIFRQHHWMNNGRPIRLQPQRNGR